MFMFLIHLDCFIILHNLQVKYMVDYNVYIYLIYYILGVKIALLVKDQNKQCYLGIRNVRYCLSITSVL